VKHLITLALAVTAALAPLAQADEAAIRQALTERYPNIQVNAVTPSPVPGIFEVLVGGKPVYTDEKADYLFAGPLVDTRNRVNLSQKRMEELRMVKFDTLPLDKAIRIVRGNGERQVAVFSDPDCPFCKRLEQELAKVDNVTVHLFLYPLAELHPKAPEVAKNVWCSADRAKSWTDYMLEGKTPAEAPACDTPIQDIAALAAKLGVEGTPAIIFSNGKRADGAIPANQIEALLKAGS
jgi:thiol:disulfide interchange protein DsbC